MRDEREDEELKDPTLVDQMVFGRTAVVSSLRYRDIL